MASAFHHIEPAVLHEAVGDDAAALQDLLQIFLGIAAPAFARLAAALQAGDAAATVQASHTLRGSVQLVGAAEFSAALLALERRARAGDPGLVRELPRLRAQFAMVEAEVHAWADAAGNGP